MSFERVLVTLTHEESMKFLNYTTEHFSEISCYRIDDLTVPTMELVLMQLEAEKTGDWSKLRYHIE